MTLEFYKEIKFATKAIYKEKGSKFISYATPIYSKLEFKEKLQEIRGLEHAAKHHCYAYVLHSDKSDRRTNDDGEPSSSAGKPILSILKASGLSNLICLITRYYGGVNLGVGGLIRAYSQCTKQCLDLAETITQTCYHRLIITVAYDRVDQIYRLSRKMKAVISDVAPAPPSPASPGPG